MTMRPLLLSALLLAAPLGACAGDDRGIETSHQPVVRRTETSLDLLAGPDGLAGGEAQRLRGWMEQVRPAHGDTIAIDDPNGSASGGDGVRVAVAAVIAPYGLRVADAAPAPAAPAPAPAAPIAPVPPGMVRIVVQRTVADVPSCATPRSRGELVNFDAHTSSDYGCAINGNLAAMVADPADLVRGKADTGARDLWTPDKALTAYRKVVQTGGGGATVKNESSGGK